MPVYVNSGSQTSTTQPSASVALPTGLLTDDILLMFIETSNEAISVTDQGKGVWTQVTNSPEGITQAGATRLTVFWSRYDGAQTYPTIGYASGNHIIAHIEAYRGCVTTGNPWNITTGGVDGSGPDSLYIPGAITTSNNCLVVIAVAEDLDLNSSTLFSNWYNGNLENITERWDRGMNTGNGGGIGVATGERPTAANYSTSHLGQNTNILVNAYMTIALQGTNPKGRNRILKIIGGDK